MNIVEIGNNIIIAGLTLNELLEDPVNLKLLEFLCSGKGITININELSKNLGKHRNTIKTKLKGIFDYKILDPPHYPFYWFFTEYPLLVIEKNDFPRDSKTNDWIEKDPYIWAAFFIKEEEYNTLMIEFHKSLHTYQNWRENIIKEEKVTFTDKTPYPSDPIFLSSQNIIKYDPSTPIHIIEDNFRKNPKIQINEFNLDELSLNIMKQLLFGKGIKTNESMLAKELNIHRRTVQRRIEQFLENKIISQAMCRFPRIWVPPEYFLVITLLEIQKNKESIIRTLRRDPRVTFIIKTFTGRYNLLLFSISYRMEDHLKWQEEYDQRFVDSIGAIKNTYLSPAMTFSIAQEYISLVFLQEKQKRLRAKTMIESLRDTSSK